MQKKVKILAAATSQGQPMLCFLFSNLKGSFATRIHEKTGFVTLMLLKGNVLLSTLCFTCNIFLKILKAITKVHCRLPTDNYFDEFPKKPVKEALKRYQTNLLKSKLLTSWISSPSKNLTGFKARRWSKRKVFGSFNARTMHLVRKGDFTFVFLQQYTFLWLNAIKFVFLDFLGNILWFSTILKYKAYHIPR